MRSLAFDSCNYFVFLAGVSVNQHERIAQFVDVVAGPGQNCGEPCAGAGNRGAEGGGGPAVPKLGCQFAA